MVKLEEMDIRPGRRIEGLVVKDEKMVVKRKGVVGRVRDAVVW